MKRASYREAVHWIAVNDDGADGADRTNEASIAGYVTTLLIADIFGVEPERVARDVVRVRCKA